MATEVKEWIVTDKERERWTRIENRDNWLLKKIPVLHPDTTKHTTLWREYSRRCVEGFWGKDFGKYRFMPPKLYFYCNFYTMSHTIEKGKPPEKIRPILRDLEWEVFYMFFVAKGFSGFSEDEEYTCNNDILEYRKNKMSLSQIDDSCFNSKGELKEYIEPLKYAKMLHDSPKGKPLYRNEPKNIMLFGSRSSGKSLMISAINLHEIIFAGEVDYDIYLEKKNKEQLNEIGICIGSAKTDKSSQFFRYMAESMAQFSTNPDLGVYSKFGLDDYEPCPFFRNMVGDLKPNNAKNMWRDEQKIPYGGMEVIKGSKSFAKHVNYQTDTEAAASGRYVYNVKEEIGLIGAAPTIWASNEFTVKRGDAKVGSLVGLGTSGDIEKVEGAKKIFLNPFTYNCVAYEDIEEHNGENGYTGFFIPAYMVNMSFKDSNGNTDIEAAKKYHYEKLKDFEKNPDKYKAQCMHAPLKISHMWYNDKEYLLPVEEAKAREKELMYKNTYMDLMLPVKLSYNPRARSGVEYEFDPKLKPITNPFLEGTDSDSEGCVVIYNAPEYKNDKLYKDQYFYVYDPYVTDESTGKSLAATYVISNPKYISEGLSGNTIMASYIGKHPGGLDKYHEEQAKLIQLYGNCERMLWYEGNRGEPCRAYYLKRNLGNLLCFKPQLAKGNNAIQKNVTSTGYIVGNLVSKLNLIRDFNDWLLEETTIGDSTLQNIFRIPCLYLIRQIQMYNTDKNFDAVSAMLGYPLGLKEYTVFLRKDTEKKANPYSFFVKHAK